MTKTTREVTDETRVTRATEAILRLAAGLAVHQADSLADITRTLRQYSHAPAGSDYWMRHYGDNNVTAARAADRMAGAVRAALDCVSSWTKIHSPGMTAGCIAEEAIAGQKKLDVALSLLKVELSGISE